ncbi:hypothetical protein NIES4101_27990 (plasmid) [Calothrix sp. NIES-4101]|nr:hypothetical protein NIES4101_27990 [Calothrix sp. NIES-4101]
MKKLAGLTVLGVTVALSSTFYLGQSLRPFNLIGVKFCPKTANNSNNSNYTPRNQAQERLDSKYCQFEHKLLKEVWDKEQFKAAKPLPESLLSRDIPAIESGTVWFLIAPISMGVAYLAWAKKCEDEETYFYELLQNFKIQVSLIGTASREEIDFKSQAIKSKWDKQRVKSGFISLEGMQDKRNRQTEIQNKTHTSTLKQFDLADSEMDKKIAENLRDKHQAEKDSQKILGKEITKIEDNSSNSTLELEEKYQWIYKLLKLPFRVLSGEQGSGKSTLERLMIRLLKSDGYHIVVVNPETNPSVWQGVEVLADAATINEFMSHFPEMVRERQQEARDLKIDEDDYLEFIKNKAENTGKIAVFLMEANTYEVHGVDPDLWANFLKQSLTNIRKWGFTVCLTAHSDNQTSISSKLLGFSKMIDAAPRVDCIAKAGSNGEATSSGKAWLKMKGAGDKEALEVELYNYPKSKKF